jgi:hypothetical protein
MGLKPTIRVFDWAKTVHALDRTATVIGETNEHCDNLFMNYRKEMFLKYLLHWSTLFHY